jgi:hypothetical protein
MTKLEKLGAVREAAYYAARDAARLEELKAAYWAACDVAYYAARDAARLEELKAAYWAACDAYMAELEKTQEEETND